MIITKKDVTEYFNNVPNYRKKDELKELINEFMPNFLEDDYISKKNHNDEIDELEDKIEELEDKISNAINELG